MAVWPGFFALREGSNSVISFEDFWHVYNHCKPVQGRTVTSTNLWGMEIISICRRRGGGNINAEVEEREKIRDIGRVLTGLLEALCFQQPSGQPHRHPSADIWDPPACPVRCINRDQLNVYDSYPKARLAVCRVRGRRPYTVEVLMHRVACWLARGEPTAATPFACHDCTRFCPGCCRLHCLDWGSNSTNQEDAYRKPSRRPKRWDGSASMCCAMELV